jgi:hypothetical protein
VAAPPPRKLHIGTAGWYVVVDALRGMLRMVCSVQIRFAQHRQNGVGPVIFSPFWSGKAVYQAFISSAARVLCCQRGRPVSWDITAGCPTSFRVAPQRHGAAAACRCGSPS